MRIEYHRTLIADHVRNQAILDALRTVIVPGETIVADIGTGTGLIGLMAARLGARKVFMYETAEVGAVAERIVRANKAGRVCELIACHSAEMIDPPRVDVVVSETLGNYAFEEHIIATLADAIARHLKPGGVLIPSHVTQFTAPVVSDRIHRELTVWDRAGAAIDIDGLDLSPARNMSLNNAYVRQLEPAELLGGDAASAIPWDRVAFSARCSSNRKGEARWLIDKPATVYGFANWWSSLLAPGISLATGPADPRTHWEQLYLPLAQPIVASRGEEIALSIRSRSSEDAGTHIAWTATHSSATRQTLSRQAHDLDKGYLP